MKTSAVLLFAVTLSTSLFLQSSAAPDPLIGLVTSGLSDIVKSSGKFTGAILGGVGDIADEAVGALLGKGGKTCTAFVLFLADLSGVLKQAQERLYSFLTVFTKELDAAIANASGALKELLTKLNAILKELLEALPELLKALVAAVAIPTNENLNKVEAGIKQLEQILAKLAEVLAEDTAGNLPIGLKYATIAVNNSARDGTGAIEVVVEALRRNRGD